VGLDASTREALQAASGRVFGENRRVAEIDTRRWRERFDYDGRGNRVRRRTPLGTLEAEFDSADRLTSFGSATLAYDANGAVTEMRTGSELFRMRYAQGRVQAVRVARVHGEGVEDHRETEIEYDYDALGRRARRVVRKRNLVEPKARGAAAGGTETRRMEWLVYEGFGLNELATLTDPGDEAAGVVLSGESGELRKRQRRSARKAVPSTSGAERSPHAAAHADGYEITLHLSAGTRPLYSRPGSHTLLEIPPTGLRKRSSSEPGSREARYFVADLLGSVRTVTDARGSVTRRLHYDCFGELLGAANQERGPAQRGGRGFRYGFAGKRRDPDTGTYDYGFRDYHPALGRFTTVDPIKDGGNWYAYAHNDPVNLVDPWGLAPRNMSTGQRARYKSTVAHYARRDTALPTYENGWRAGEEWDCADLATHIASSAMEQATGAEQYHRRFRIDEGPLEYVPAIHSSDFANEDRGVITFYRNPDGSIDNAFDSENVEAGTIGVFNNHIITVTRDRENRYAAIETIQGHYRGDSDRKEIIDSQGELDSYIGTFIGWGEIGRDSTQPLPDPDPVYEAGCRKIAGRGKYQ
jgi:RHS repeat-associated protein